MSDGSGRDGDDDGRSATGGPPAGDSRTRDSQTDDPSTVVAQGTFDVLHPGHVHYLEEAATFGDELYVIVARDANVSHKPTPIVPEGQRRDVVAALEVVDRALLGDPDDIFVPIERIQPAAIVLGHDQHHDESALTAELDDRGIDCDLHRASPRPQTNEDELLSTGRIIEKILRERS